MDESSNKSIMQFTGAGYKDWKERIKWREENEWKRNEGRVAEKNRKGNT